MKPFTLSEVGNTYDYGLNIIVEKGYKIFIVPDKREDYFGEYWVLNKTHTFIGSSPLVVLGLIGIWERYGDNWWKDSGNSPKNHSKLIEGRAFPDRLSDFESLSNQEFKTFVSEYKLLFKALKSWNKYEINDGVSRKEMYDLVNMYWKEENDR